MKEIDEWEFAFGDVICELGMVQKWVVLNCSGAYGDDWPTYTLKRLDMSGELTCKDSWGKRYCEEKCIKVGKWDSYRKREIDDGT